MLVYVFAHAQQFKLSGKVLNVEETGLSNVELNFPELNQSIRTSPDGTFSFRLQKVKKLHVIISKTGFERMAKTLDFSSADNQDSIFITIHINPVAHQLKEVTVKDNLAEQRRDSESMNVETMKRDDLLRNLGGSLMKSMERLPGVKTIGIGSGQSKPLIRGLGFNRVVVLDKGIKHEGQQWGADHGLEIDQFATAGVEIIKGAASFLYGADAIGGVIDVKPELPPAPHTLDGAVEFSGKSNNKAYGTSLNLKGRNQHWFFNGRLTYQNYADYVVPTDSLFVYDYKVMLKNGRLRNTAGRETNFHLSTGYIDEKFRSVFYVSNVYSRSGFFANAHGLEPRRVDAALYDASDRDIMMPNQEVNHFKIVNRTDYYLGKHHLKFDGAYQYNFREEFSQYVNHGYMPAIYPTDSRIPSNLERQFNKQVFSVSARDEIRIGQHELQLGVNSEYQTNRINGWSFLVPSFNQLNTGIFIYDKLQLSDQLILHGALRFDYGQINMQRYDDWFTTPIETGNGTIQQYLTRANNLSRTFNSFVYALGLNYNTTHFKFKWNLGKSFRMPIAKELGANGVNYHYFSYEKGNPALSPEVSYQTDLGIYYESPFVNVSFSPFYNYFPNYIYLNPTSKHDYDYGAGNQIFEYAQSRVTRYGGELAIKGKFLSHFNAEILAEYLFAKQLSGDKKGYVLPFSPPPSVLVSLGYQADLSKTIKDFYFSADYRFTARQNNIVPPERKTPGASLFNLQTGAKVAFWKNPVSINVQVQNLLNTRFLNHTSFYRLIDLPEAGRNLILSVSIPFTLK